MNENINIVPLRQLDEIDKISSSNIGE